MAKVRNRRPTIRELQRAGIPIHSSREYFKDWPKPKRQVSLQEVRTILAKVPVSLAEEVARMREEGW